MTESVPGRATAGRRHTFRAWRRNRPLWGCVFVFLSGLELWALTVSPYELTVVQGVAGVSGLMIFGVMAALALVCLLQPSQHTVAGALCVVVALASLPLSNLGGFMIGMLLGVHGGSLMVSWRPPEDEEPDVAPSAGTGVLPVGGAAAGAALAEVQPADLQPVSPPPVNVPPPPATVPVKAPGTDQPGPD